MKKMKKLMAIATIACFTVLAMPNDADAAYSGDGYVCTAHHTPWFGDFGYVEVSFYSQSHCQGSYLGSSFFFSEGTTTYIDRADMLYSEAQLMGLLEAVTDAVENGTHIYTWGSTSELQGHWIRFNGN